MSSESQENSSQSKHTLELSSWYYVSVFVLAALSLVTLSNKGAGEWEFTLGVRETMPILLALAILPHPQRH